jgi:hypothetical protein
MMSGLLFSSVLWGGLLTGSETLLGPSATRLIEDLGSRYEELIGPDADPKPEEWGIPTYDI